MKWFHAEPRLTDPDQLPIERATARLDEVNRKLLSFDQEEFGPDIHPEDLEMLEKGFQMMEESVATLAPQIKALRERC